MSVAAEAAEPRLVTKLALCKALKWSRMRLERRLEADAAFPVVTRGTQAGGWSFDLDAVQAYLAPEEEREEVAEDLSTPAGQAARAELTARQRRDLAQAQLHEDKLRRMRGELVEAAELKMALSETVTRVSTALNKLPETLIRRLTLPGTAEPVLRQEVDEIRRALVVGLRELLADG
jgi:phage terminase Nu1 subunit (DNA packaging protein)